MKMLHIAPHNAGHPGQSAAQTGSAACLVTFLLAVGLLLDLFPYLP
jgi:hypothetical protein